MGGLAVGKTTIISTAVTRTPQKRSMPYTRSRINQRFVTTVKEPQGHSLVFELIDTKGNETLENLDAEYSPDEHFAPERRSLLGKEKANVHWAYMVVFDYTRHETYLYAKKLIDQIRTNERIYQASRARKIPPAVIILLGNKKENCATPTILPWIRDQQKIGRERNAFLFSGSALENSFMSLEKPGTYEANIVCKHFGMSDNGDPSDYLGFRVSTEEILLFLKNKEDADFGRGEYSTKRSAFDDGFNPALDMSLQEEDEVLAEGNCCTRCCRRCFRKG
jgi:GTPase SAR1 family protein